MNNDISFGILSGWQFLFSLNVADLVSLFWFLILLEMPRYLIGAVVFLIFSVRTGMRRYRGRSRVAAFPFGSHPPTFSVIVAGHNEGETLRRCVESLWEQTAMWDGARKVRLGEIVVVNDGSTDETADVIADLRREGLLDVGLSLQLRGGKSAATNFALAHCHNEFVIVVDADTSFDRDSFERLLEPFADERIGAVSGNLFVRNAKASLTTVYQDIEYRIGISLGRRVSELFNLLSVVSGAFGAFRRSALDEVGGFDVEIGEDADLTMKLRQAGWRVVFQPSANAGTAVPETVLALTRQRLRWNHSVVTIWLRKYNHLLNPFRANFDIANALVIWDVLFMQVLMSAVFFIYLGWLVYAFGWFSLVVISATLLAYMVLAAVMLLVSALADDSGHAIPLFPYLPHFVLFGCFVIRAVRLYSAVDEWIFRRSYHDTYVPRRVMKEVEKY